jgi:hypothetical protein
MGRRCEQLEKEKRKMKTMRVRWTGVRPLLMSNGELVDHLNPIVMAKRVIQEKGSKKLTEADHEQLLWLGWRGGLYWHEEIGLYIPSDNIEKCIKEGAMKSKLGKQAEAACFVAEPLVKIACDGQAKSPEALYKQERFRFRKAVRTPPRTGGRVMTERPMIPTGWGIEFTIEYDEHVIDAKDLIKAMINAGTLVGLGDWRPKFGRFTVEVGE